MDTKKKLVSTAVMCFLSLSGIDQSVAHENNEASPKTEKCYGIARKGMNDCPTAQSSCAGSATRDGQPDAFIFLPKGMCKRIVGGSLTKK